MTTEITDSQRDLLHLLRPRDAGFHRDVLKARAALPKRLDGDLQTTVGRRRGQGERMRGEPVVACKKPPTKELSGLRRKFGEVLSLYLNASPRQGPPPPPRPRAGGAARPAATE
jgi:hypothetical protein